MRMRCRELDLSHNTLGLASRVGIVAIADACLYMRHVRSCFAYNKVAVELAIFSVVWDAAAGTLEHFGQRVAR